MDKVKLKLPENLDPRISHFHSNSNTEGTEDDKMKEIEKKKKYFKEMWDKVKLSTRKKIFEIYEQDLEMFGYSWNYENNEIKFDL